MDKRHQLGMSLEWLLHSVHDGATYVLTSAALGPMSCIPYLLPAQQMIGDQLTTAEWQWTWRGSLLVFSTGCGSRRKGAAKVHFLSVCARHQLYTSCIEIRKVKTQVISHIHGYGKITAKMTTECKILTSALRISVRCNIHFGMSSFSIK